MNPTFPEPYFALGRIEASRGQIERALALLDAARERGATDAAFVEWRAYVLGRLRRYEEALQGYLEVMEEGEPGVAVNAARMLLALGRYDEAVEMLQGCDDPTAVGMLEAIPRYREFVRGERADSIRAARYFGAGTVILGDGADESPAESSFQLLESAQVVQVLRRLVRLSQEAQWRIDWIAGEGPHHGPLAELLAELLSVPRVYRRERPRDGAGLLVSAVIHSGAEARALLSPWEGAERRVLHFALALSPRVESTPDEPALIGFVSRTAVPWYRVERESRLTAGDPAGRPGAMATEEIEVGPAFVDPNTPRVLDGLRRALAEAPPDPIGPRLMVWYQRHRRARAFDWSARGEEKH